MKRRPFALIAPPVLALLGAALYTHYRVAGAERAVGEFCASVGVGTPIRDFATRALAEEFEVHDLGADSPELVASRKVYGWREEVFECRAERDDAGLVRSVRTARRAVD
jgi:hypothetical protein